MPLFSVVIPTYNRSEKLEATLRSVLNQTCDDFEVLVMDDGSTDYTAQAIQCIDDPRIKYSWAKNSGGPATPRNRGIEMAQGDWVCFLDADDLWYPDKLMVLRDFILCHPALDVVCHDEIFFDRNNGYRRRVCYGPFAKNFYQTLLVKGNRLSTSAVSVRRDFLVSHKLRFNQSRDYVIVEDYDFWLSLANCRAQFGFIHSPLGEYIIEDDNLTSFHDRHVRNEVRLLHDHVYRIQSFQKNKDLLWSIVMARVDMQAIDVALVAHHYAIALRLLVKVLIGRPVGFVVFFVEYLRRRFYRVVCVGTGN